MINYTRMCSKSKRLIHYVAYNPEVPYQKSICGYRMERKAPHSGLVCTKCLDIRNKQSHTH